MDRIIITQHQVYLQKDNGTRLGKPVSYEQVTLLTAEDADLVAQVAALREKLSPLFWAQQKPLREEIFMIEEPMGAHPQDAELLLTACCGLGQHVNYNRFVSSVVVKHHKNGKYLPELDKMVELVADNTTLLPVDAAGDLVLPDANGQIDASRIDRMVGEHDYLLAKIDTTLIKPLIRQMLHLRKERFY